MLTLALMVLAQAGSPECLTVGGARTCGYDCKKVGGVVRCAQTPQGVCLQGSEGVLCYDPPLWLTQVMKKVPAPTCLWRGANGACGYDCQALSETVACAATPRGSCISAYGKLACADPTPATWGVYGEEPPRPKCIAEKSTVICGYDCKVTDLSSGCAATPWGACTLVGGRVVCADPPEAVICAGGKSTEKVACKAYGDRGNCGYGCVDKAGTVVCAKTPGGRCEVTLADGPACFDPPVTGGSERCLSVLGTR